MSTLPNKSDELEIFVKTRKIYRECRLMCFTETWLNQNISDSCVDLPGFTLIRSDRDAKASGKIKGGGLALFVNQRWCNPAHITVKERLCSPDIELLAVGMRPPLPPKRIRSYNNNPCVHSTQSNRWSSMWCHPWNCCQDTDRAPWSPDNNIRRLQSCYPLLPPDWIYPVC